MSRRLRIATFNLENLDEGPEVEPPMEERIAVLGPQLLRLDADVLCLQEVNAQPPATGKGPRRLEALRRLLDATPYRDFAQAISTVSGGEAPSDVHNLVILSRFPVLERRQLWHDLVPPPLYPWVTAAPRPGGPQEVRWDRPILTVTLDLGGGRRLHVLNLHLRAPLAAFIPGQKTGAFAWKSVGGWAEGYYLASMKRAGQALEARLYLDRLFDRDPAALIAVCGDFNADAREVPVRTILADPEDTGSGELALRAMVCLERTVPEDRRFSVVHAGHAQMLDHLLVSRTLLTWYRGAEIHNEALGDELVAYANVTRSPESYHAPVVAEFDLPEG